MNQITKYVYPATTAKTRLATPYTVNPIMMSPASALYTALVNAVQPQVPRSRIATNPKKRMLIRAALTINLWALSPKWNNPTYYIIR